MPLRSWEMVTPSRVPNSSNISCRSSAAAVKGTPRILMVRDSMGARHFSTCPRRARNGCEGQHHKTAHEGIGVSAPLPTVIHRPKISSPFSCRARSASSPALSFTTPKPARRGRGSYQHSVRGFHGHGCSSHLTLGRAGPGGVVRGHGDVHRVHPEVPEEVADVLLLGRVWQP